MARRKSGLSPHPENVKPAEEPVWLRGLAPAPLLVFVRQVKLVGLGEPRQVFADGFQTREPPAGIDGVGKSHLY